MAIPISSNFDLSSGLPLDSRTVVDTIVNRDLIPAIQRYVGLSVFVTEDNTTYQLQDGTTNGDWVAIGGGSGATWGSITGTLSGQTDLQNELNTKQATLVSGTNIKTINGNDLLGSGNIVISGGSGSGATWGSIAGTLSTQTDLQTALNLKANLASPTFTGVVGLPAGQVVNGVRLITTGTTTNFLRADGTYAAPSGGGPITLVNTTSLFSTSIGAGNSSTVQFSNFFGQDAGNSAGNNNVTGASHSNVTGASHSNFFGHRAGAFVTDASHSNFFGNNAGANSYNTGDSNFFGFQAGQSATDASFSNFFGHRAGERGDKVTQSNFLGRFAGYLSKNVGLSNFIGGSAGYLVTGSSISIFGSNFIGHAAGYGANEAEKSNYIGFGAGSNARGAFESNFIGYSAGYEAINASNSNFFGREAGNGATGVSFSNLFGYQVGKVFNGSTIGTNNIIIGTNISLPNGTTNSMNLGGILFGVNTHGTTTGNPSIVANSSGRIGVGVVTPTARLHIAASTSAAALMRLTVGSAPSVPNDGDVWLQSNTTAGLKIRLSGVTKTIVTESGVTWGSITGTLSGQTDLQTALNLKANISGASLTSAVVNGVTLITTGGTTNFLRADGTYAAPSGGGSGSGAFIPLSGTSALASVTGNIEVYDTFKLYDSTPVTGGEKSFKFTSDYVEISNSSSSGVSPTRIVVSSNEITVFCSSESHGLIGNIDFSPNYSDLTYIQKIYADTERIDNKVVNYILNPTDLGRTIETNTAGANTLTINSTTLSTLPVGGKINIVQYGAGQTQVLVAGGAVLRSAGGADKIANRYGAATMVKRNATEFYLFGDITV